MARKLLQLLLIILTASSILSYISFSHILSVIEKNEQENQKHLLVDIKTQINLSFKLLDNLLIHKRKDYKELHKLTQTLITQANDSYDLSSLQKIIEEKAGFPVELYIINADLKIIETTFLPDLGLDFSVYPFTNVKDYLIRVRQTKQIAIGQPNIEFISKQVKIYSMSILDNEHYLELAFIDPDINEYFKNLNDYITNRNDAQISIFVEFWDKILMPMTFIPEKNTNNKIAQFKQREINTKNDQLAFEYVTREGLHYQKSTQDTHGNNINSYYIQLAGLSSAFIKKYSNRYLAKIVFDGKKTLQIRKQFQQFLFLSSIVSIVGILFFALYIRHWLIKPINLILSSIQNQLPVKPQQLSSTSNEIKAIASTYNETLEHLHSSMSELKQQANIDSLTGLNNRRKFTQSFDQEILRARRYHFSIALIMIDIDNFKEHNDLYGHQQGDQLLINLAQQMKKTFLRPTDHLCRMGGDELSALLIDIEPSKVVLMFEDFQQKWNVQYHKNFVTDNDKLIPVIASLSIGIYIFSSKLSPSWENAYKRADAALYTAKNQGRNLIEINEDKACT